MTHFNLLELSEIKAFPKKLNLEEGDCSLYFLKECIEK